MVQSAQPHPASLTDSILLKRKKSVRYFRNIMSTLRKSVHETSPADSRKRQVKKDEAIRRKVEYELSKKRGQKSKLSRTKKVAPGTVLFLKPSEPIICKASTTVYEAAQLMSARRENCILVVNKTGLLIGIFTAKDLAFRIVGSGLNASTTVIDQIMTPSPICAQANSPASEALTLMLEKGFRHLPVLDGDDHIVGVLDITKSYAQQMEKLERLHTSSKKLYEAMDAVHSEMGVTEQPHHVYEYFEDLKSKMAGPTLQTVLDDATTPVYVNVKSTVYDATILMKKHKTTAVLVKDSQDHVAGIFTSKDVVLRVIAAGLDPKKCSVVRVMTPHPDVSPATTSIQLALRQMFDGHYLNLPVVNGNKDIIGIVDVLKLTYATLNQIQRIELNPLISKPKEEGPAWNKFWTSLDTHETDSAFSDSVASGPSAPEVNPSEFHQSDIHPSDSISAVGEASSEQPTKVTSNSSVHTGDTSSKQPTKVASNSSVHSDEFTFKFKSPAVQGRVHRVSIKSTESLQELRSIIDEKLKPNDLEQIQATKDGDSAYAISYVDEDGDVVSITSNNDLKDCIRINQEMEKNKADLYLHNPHEPAPVEVLPKELDEVLPGVSNQVLLSGAIGLASLLAAMFVVMRRK